MYNYKDVNTDDDEQVNKIKMISTQCSDENGSEITHYLIQQTELIISKVIFLHCIIINCIIKWEEIDAYDQDLCFYMSQYLSRVSGLSFFVKEIVVDLQNALNTEYQLWFKFEKQYFDQKQQDLNYYFIEECFQRYSQIIQAYKRIQQINQGNCSQKLNYELDKLIQQLQ